MYRWAEWKPAILPQNALSEIEWVDILWTENRLTMNIPVYVDNIPKPFYMQFDLGKPCSNLLNISTFFPQLKAKEGGRNSTYYKDIHLSVGKNIRYQAEKMPIKEYGGRIDSLIENDSTYENKIGDIGYDFIKNRVLIIDFIHSKIGLAENLPEYFAQNTHFVQADLQNSAAYIPISVGGITKNIRYDNGSSMFSLIANRKDWEKWTIQTEHSDTTWAQAWGKRYYALNKKAAVKIEICGKDYSNQNIWTIERYNTVIHGMLRFYDTYLGGIYSGIVGNEYFRNEIIILDTKNNLFGIFKIEN